MQRRRRTVLAVGLNVLLVAGAVTGCASADRGLGATVSSAVGPAAASSSPPTTATPTTAVPSTSVPSTSVPSTSAPATTHPRAPQASAKSTSPAVARPTAHLAGTVVALNPGHNGGNADHAGEIGRPVPAGFGTTRACDTTGTSTSAGYPEHAFNWDVTLRVRRLLQERGLRVILSRPDDRGVGPCIDRRAALTNAAAAVVSIHADGTPDGHGHGFHVCEDSRQPAGAAVAAASHRLTVAVHDALVRSSGLVPSTYIGSNGYYPRDDLAGLNLATNPATFLELGNMRNAGDAELQTSAAGRQRIAAAIADGILVWLGSR
ncbi:MAG: N-acetylmuramoyl-L-alanine amidase [bacterium]